MSFGQIYHELLFMSCVCVYILYADHAVGINGRIVIAHAVNQQRNLLTHALVLRV